MRIRRRSILGWASSAGLGFGAASGCRPPSPAGRIEIRGSDSEVNLVRRLGTSFAAERDDVRVAVTGGGSGTGIASLIDGHIAIANSSREMKPGERLLALRRGMTPVATLFATDALSVIVHAANPVAQLTIDQVGAMFAGRSRDWKLYGGEGDTVCYGRQSSSGTSSFFRQAVVRGAYARDVRQMNGHDQIVEAVARDPGGIGYVAVAYVKSGAAGIRALPIAPAIGQSGVDPLDQAAVVAGRYPIARPLYQFTHGVPAGVVRDFLRYELSEEGEKIVAEMGFYPVVDAWRDRNAHLRDPPPP